MGKPFKTYLNVEKGVMPMTVQVCWLDDLAQAQEAAKRTNKPILLDFFYSQ
jgi:hypothetical protein